MAVNKAGCTRQIGSFFSPKGVGVDREELPFMRQYRAWLDVADHNDRESYFRSGLIVLDTNVLHSLYEYTPSAREEILNALERVAPNLWLPYQVGLEFVRGRHRVIAKRSKALSDASDQINQKFNEARQAIMGASAIVKNLLARYTQNSEARTHIEDEITQQNFDNLVADWRRTLTAYARTIKEEHDIALKSLTENDPILPRVASLYGERIASAPAMETLRRRVEEASAFRFPNKIPPGFMDEKPTPMDTAGDFLIWEEVVEQAATLQQPRRLLFVSADAKDDWYEPAEPGRRARPWPLLIDELKTRADASLRIESPNEFFQGVRDFLDVEIADQTTREIDRALESYTHTTRQLHQDMREIIHEELPENCDEFHQILDSISEHLTSSYGGRIPQKYLYPHHRSRTHELFFSLLLQRLGEDVPVVLFQALSDHGIHTERRIRELRELGMDIESTRTEYGMTYRLNSLEIDPAAAKSIVRRNISMNKSLSLSKREALLAELEI
ncbi:PIN-like domain-containing protein [Streptomyces sp. NPDC059757]|uniref:PIN-like domain-containing protein n=1 Tax=Streptomyces sp. NPDC059757 TaxID=3346935 RepID=UPI00365D427F